jgi:small subunit ribosomal protein S15
MYKIYYVYYSFSRHERDTASPPVTACAYNEKVAHMVAHIRSHPKDAKSRHKLREIVSKRRHYMMYLKGKDYNTYAYILRYYGLKDMPDHNYSGEKNLRQTSWHHH